MRTGSAIRRDEFRMQFPWLILSLVRRRRPDTRSDGYCAEAPSAPSHRKLTGLLTRTMEYKWRPPRSLPCNACDTYSAAAYRNCVRQVRRCHCPSPAENLDFRHSILIGILLRKILAQIMWRARMSLFCLSCLTSGSHPTKRQPGAVTSSCVGVFVQHRQFSHLSAFAVRWTLNIMQVYLLCYRVYTYLLFATSDTRLLCLIHVAYIRVSMALEGRRR